MRLRYRLIETGLIGPQGKKYNLYKEYGCTSDSNLFQLVPADDGPAVAPPNKGWFPTQQAAHEWLQPTRRVAPIVAEPQAELVEV